MCFIVIIRACGGLQPPREAGALMCELSAVHPVGLLSFTRSHIATHLLQAVITRNNANAEVFFL